MNDVIGVLAKRGDLFFIDSKTSASSVGEQVAAAQGATRLHRATCFWTIKKTLNTPKDNCAKPRPLRSRTGSAIAIGHPRPTTLAAVKALIPELRSGGDRKFVLASDLVKH